MIVSLLHCLTVIQKPYTGIRIEMGIPRKSPIEGFQLCSSKEEHVQKDPEFLLQRQHDRLMPFPASSVVSIHCTAH
jgi:hypothetical protein